jgi:hypothetical protein
VNIIHSKAKHTEGKFAQLILQIIYNHVEIKTKSSYINIESHEISYRVFCVMPENKL